MNVFTVWLPRNDRFIGEKVQLKKSQLLHTIALYVNATYFKHSFEKKMFQRDRKISAVLFYLLFLKPLKTQSSNIFKIDQNILTLLSFSFFFYFSSFGLNQDTLMIGRAHFNSPTVSSVRYRYLSSVALTDSK